MHPPGADTVLVRHGEVGVKSPQVRRKMEARLRDNVEALLADGGVEGVVERRRNRILVRTDAVEAATDAACDAFGVVSASPALSAPPELDPIRDALAEAAREHYAAGAFAVRARRAGEKDAHPFSSRDIEVEGGDAVWAAVEDRFEPAVDLDHPDVEFFVECRQDEAFVFLEKRSGPGGLPLGTQRPVVALVSGGIDSPVAAWETMKRGAPVVPVYVALGDYGGPDHRARAVAAVGKLARYAPTEDVRVRVVPGGDAVARIAEETGKTRMLAFRRFMFRAAEHVARTEDAVGIVTGESIGQKSSQTTANLAVTSAATDLPVHRPLLTRDKDDITAQARAIGTYEEATIPAGCNRIAPSFPETRATLEQVEAAEPDDLFELAREAAEGVELVDPAPVLPQ